MSSQISPVQDIIADVGSGRMVILVDEEERENEGDLLLAADFVAPEAINFMTKYGRGLICLTLTEERCQQLSLPLMVLQNRSLLGTNFTVSIDAREGITTGISAADRARTIQVAVKKDAGPEDIAQPGHVFPLKAQQGGVLARAGHTEAGCDLAQLAGLTPAAVICEVLKENGEMARLPDLLEFAKQHQLKIGTIADLIHYRSRTESLVTRVTERIVETVHGKFKLIGYSDKTANAIHLALVKGEIVPGEETLVRVHAPLSIMDLLDTGSGGHTWSVYDAQKTLAAAGKGVIVLLQGQDGTDDLMERLKPGRASEKKQTRTDLRNYGIGMQILKDLNVTKMRLLAAPRKMPSMAGFGLEVTGYELPDKK